MRLIRDLKG